MSRTINIRKDISLERIRAEKKKVKNEWAYFEKLTFLEDIYSGETVKYAIEKRGKNHQTGYNWVKAWNEKGFDGLKRKPGSGAKSKLTNEELIKLKKLINKNELTETRQIRKLIITEFDVIYSIRQVERILKKLNYGYAKPYIIPSNSPDNAEEIIKERLEDENVSLHNDIFGFLDQSGFQNQKNNSRQHYDKDIGNTKKEPPIKLKVNSNGFQMVNGYSLMLCQPNTRTFEMIKSLIELRILNTANEEIKEKLTSILNDKRIDFITIYEKLKKEFEAKDLKKNLLNFLNNTNASNYGILIKTNKLLEYSNPKFYKNIEDIQKNTIVDLLEESEIKKDLENKKRIVLLADNYQVHKAKLVKKACNILNIKFVQSATASPHLNPIEQVWKSIKNYIGHFYLDDLDKMEELVTKEFKRIVDNSTFYNKWLLKFFDDIDYDIINYQLKGFSNCVRGY